MRQLVDTHLLYLKESKGVRFQNIWNQRVTADCGRRSVEIVELRCTDLPSPGPLSPYFGDKVLSLSELADEYRCNVLKTKALMSKYPESTSYGWLRIVKNSGQKKRAARGWMNTRARSIASPHRLSGCGRFTVSQPYLPSPLGGVLERSPVL
jgi:hypothetical protein